MSFEITYFILETKSIIYVTNPFNQPVMEFRVTGDSEPVTVQRYRVRAGYVLDRLPVYHMADKARLTNIHYLLTSSANLEFN